MRFVIKLTVTVAAAVMAGCGGGDDDPDAAAVDAAVAIDAVTLTPDAMVAPDASTDEIAMICANLCTHIFVDCQDQPVEQDCVTGCQDDLADCSGEQLATLEDCAELACTVGEPEPVIMCLTAVACVDF